MLIAGQVVITSAALFPYGAGKAGSNSSLSSVNAANRIRCIRTEKWKFDYYFDDLGAYYRQFELYDLVKDPLETNNLAYDPAYKKTRDDLEKQLQELEVSKLMIIQPPHVLQGNGKPSKKGAKLVH